MTDKKISVVLADDHQMVCAALHAWLSTQPDLLVAQCVQDGSAAVDAVLTHQPDVAVLDIDMPGLFAFEAARRIQVVSPRTRVLFLSAFVSDVYVEQALAAGAVGYLTKGDSPAVLADAIRGVTSGQTAFSAAIQARIVVREDGLHLASETTERTAHLTARELEVLRYLAQGLAKKQIARQLALSVGTVNNHAANLMRKLHIHDRVELTRYAIREGIVTAT